MIVRLVSHQSIFIVARKDRWSSASARLTGALGKIEEIHVQWFAAEDLLQANPFLC